MEWFLATIYTKINNLMLMMIFFTIYFLFPFLLLKNNKMLSDILIINLKEYI